MGFFSRFKRKPRTYSSNFSSYRSLRSSTRKPFEPKKTAAERVSRGGFAYKALRIFKILGVLFLLGLLTYAIFFTKLFEIQKIDVKGNEATVTEQSTLNKILQEHLGKNLLTFNTTLLEQELYDDYPYLKDLDVGRDFFHTLSVDLETYENVANVRVDFEDGSEQVYVVNELGFVSGTGTTLESLPTVVMDVTGTEMDLTAYEAEPVPASEEPSEETEEEESEATTEDTEVSEETAETLTETRKTSFLLNEELIDAEVLKTLLKTTEDFEGKFDMQVLEIHYLKQARELHLVTERLFTIWIDLTQDSNLQLTKLKKATGTVLNIYEANLEYIDLRISGQNGEKVIYKLKDSIE